MIKLPNTLSFRLTLWYSVLFALFFSIALLILYLSIDKILEKRLNAELEEDVQEFTALFNEGGMQSVIHEIEQEIKTDDTSEFFIRILSLGGDEIYSTDLSEWKGIHSIQTTLRKVTSNNDNIVLEDIHFSSQDYPTKIAYGLIAPDLILQVGESTEENNEIIELLPLVLVSMFFIALPIAAFIGWLVARKGVAGINEINNAAAAMKHGEINQKVSLNKQYDEIQTLASTFNAMSERINKLITEMREMIDNIAHDMRSPLTRIRAISENSLSHSVEKEEYKTSAEDTLVECDRLIQMINTTLDVAEAEAGVLSRTKENIDVSSLIEEACEIFDPLAENKEVELSFSLKPECKITGNKQSLQRMLANLVDNAIKYTNERSTINIVLEKNNDSAVIDVTDQGDGISEEDQSRVFQRFFRCDNSRTHKGNGLGLSYAIAVARSHGGDIKIDRSNEFGTTFKVFLPI